MLSAAWPARADACSPGPCPRAKVPISEGAVVPANIPGIPFKPGRDWFGKGEGLDYATLTLRDESSGTEVPLLDGPMAPPTVYYTTAYERFMTPTEALRPGPWSLIFADACGASPGPRKVSFSVTEPTEFPTSIGALRAASHALTGVKVEAGAKCTKTISADAITLALDTTPAFEAFRPIAVLSVLVDGRGWSGPVTDYSGNGYPDTFDPMTVFAACDGTSRLAAGKHTIEVRAHLEGAPSDPAPTTVDVDFSCGATAAPVPSYSDSSSCSAGGRSARRPPTAVLMLLVGALGCATRFRRRRR